MRIDFFENGKLGFLIFVAAYSMWLEVGGGNPHEFYDQLDNHWGFFTHVVCTLRNTGGGGFGQRAGDLASEDFSQFLKEHGIRFTLVPPYRPASNGAAERSVQTAKTVLTKQVLNGKANSLSLEHRLANFLILNRSTPHTVTGQSLAELFLGRQIRNCFTLLKSSLNRAMEEQQLKQKVHHDERRVKLREFNLNEVVLVRN